MMNKNRIEKPDNIMFGSPWFCACPLPDSIPLRGHLPIIIIIIMIIIGVVTIVCNASGHSEWPQGSSPLVTPKKRTKKKTKTNSMMKKQTKKKNKRKKKKMKKKKSANKKNEQKRLR